MEKEHSRQPRKEQFINVTKDRLVGNPLSEYIAEEVWMSKSPNIRDCVRIASIARCEQDVLRMLRIVNSGTETVEF